MQIYVHKNNQQLGPFSEAEIKAQLAAGTITLLDHVWWQGQANWVPLGQTPLAAPLPGMPPVAVPGTPAEMIAPRGTSQLAIWSLVCGCLCLTLICSSIACLPAIILGHLALSSIKKNPGLQGRGMAIGGMALGYFFALFVIASWVILATLGNQVKEIYKTLNAQAAEAANSPDDSTTNSDQSTNSSDQSTPSSSDSTTNPAPANQ